MSRKYLRCVLLWTLLASMLFGCSQSTVIESCITHPGEEEVPLTEEAELFILDLWENGDWEIANTKDIYHYVFETSEGTVYYCFDVGTFNHVTKNRHLQLSDAQKEQLNEFLQTEEYFYYEYLPAFAE